MPKISIIIPVYNGRHFIRRAISSVLRQSYSNWELICVDDGSTDDTADILRDYGERIRVLPSGHRGAPAARNIGIAAASGDFIAFLDADDQFTDNALASQLSVYASQAAVDRASIVLGRSTTVFETDDSRNNYFLNPAEAHDRYLSVLGAVLVPAPVFQLTGNFNEALLTVDDTDWFMKVSDLGINIIFNDHTTLLINRHGGNLTGQSAQTSRAHLELFRSRILKKRNG